MYVKTGYWKTGYTVGNDGSRAYSCGGAGGGH